MDSTLYLERVHLEATLRHYLLLMHRDTTADPSADMWASYFKRLHESGKFEGGSAIGEGKTIRKQGIAAGISEHLAGYIRIEAATLEEAERFVADNPVFECGGTVELRELPRE